MNAPNDYPAPLEELIARLKQLPGVGRRGAERLALAMLKFSADDLRSFGKIIAELPESVGACPVCGNITTGHELCKVCASPRRDQGIICVVEDFTRISGLERSGGFQGVYHVLGGRLSPLDDATEETLRIAPLEERIAAGGVRELILALGGDVESRATAIFLARRFEGKVPIITQLAQGLPAGGDLAYADSATILAALSGRRKL